MLRALEDIRAAGKARAVAVASDESAGLAAMRSGAPFGVVQAAVPAPGRAGRAPAGGPGGGLRAWSCTRSSASTGSLAALKARAAADPAFRAAVTGGAGDLDRALARRLLARAFALNPDGVVLVSMFSDASRAQNRRQSPRRRPIRPPRAADRLGHLRPARGSARLTAA